MMESEKTTFNTDTAMKHGQIKAVIWGIIN